MIQQKIECVMSMNTLFLFGSKFHIETARFKERKILDGFKLIIFQVANRFDFR